MKKSKTHYYVLVLGNLLFWIPVIMLSLNRGLSDSYSLLLDTIPLYLMFMAFMLMVFQLAKKTDVAFVFSEALGIPKALKSYYSEYLSEKKVNVIWGIFWISFFISFIHTFVYLVISK